MCQAGKTEKEKKKGNQNWREVTRLAYEHFKNRVQAYKLIQFVSDLFRILFTIKLRNSVLIHQWIVPKLICM